MMKQIQAGSGALFAAFVFVHLINTFLAAFGIAAYDGFQGAVRVVYQAFFIEMLLLGALLVHLVVGITRIVFEPIRSLSTRARWHRDAGVFGQFGVEGGFAGGGGGGAMSRGTETQVFFYCL